MCRIIYTYLYTNINKVCSFVKMSWIFQNIQVFFFLYNIILIVDMETEGGGHQREGSSFEY